MLHNFLCMYPHYLHSCFPRMEVRPSYVTDDSKSVSFFPGFFSEEKLVQVFQT